MKTVIGNYFMKTICFWPLARETFETAVESEPSDGYIGRNLGDDILIGFKRLDRGVSHRARHWRRCWTTLRPSSAWRRRRKKVGTDSAGRRLPAGRGDVHRQRLAALQEGWPEAALATALAIAMLGRTGLDINDPTDKYKLKSLQGKFSGLHLAAVMYTAFRQIDPTMHAGADFAAEYQAAVEMQSK